ncbi:WD40-repeat-containing domain superfamily [Arabidopsis thaliana x Arabidopsis arenosa]|uniref:WD40-repeat-containing domain superfamily n=1 Tax=Arabidopsis thaliana x Arabidopsis arenosa TaxID=1240361 RepID=A0A8T2AGM2_9BRAS|nr:WD40-repeat-containing domain superfamily [Arabidopsis thaliana x Arabidopsis arenosa]
MNVERVAEETVASNNNIQLKGRVDDVPCKLDALHNNMVIESENGNSDCPGSSAHRNVEMTKPPPPEESAGAKLSVEELTLGNYRIVQGTNTTNMDSSRAGKFEHLYRLARGSSLRAGDGDLDSQPRDMDQMLSRIRQQLAGAPSERQNLKPFMTRRSDQNLEAFSERLRAAGENSIMKAPALISSEGVQLNTPVSSSNFSQLLLKRAMKGKGVVGKNQESPPEFVSDQDLGSKEKKLDSSKSPTPHNVLPLKSSPKGNGMVSHGDGNHNKSSYGISLREFLRSSYAKREKRHSLLLFRQLVELVDSAHSKGLFLLDLRPSLFTLVPSKKLRYIGTFGKNNLDSDVDEDLNRRRPVVQESSIGGRDSKKRKMYLHVQSPGSQLQATSTGRPFKRKSPVIDLNVVDARNPDSCELQQQDYIKNLSVSSMTRKQSMSWLEEQWYTCPEEINGEDIGEKSNIYALGVLLFELLCHCESGEMHAAMMADLRHRILPPTFLSKYPKEAGFCLWLLHPEPSSRPTARDILKSELICEDDSVKSTAAAEEISELLLHFLSSLEVQKQKKASKLLQDIQTLEDDIKEAERRYSSNASLVRSHGATEKRVQSSPLDEHCTTSGALVVPSANTDRLMSNIRQLEDAYFFMRSQINLSSSAASTRSEKIILKDRDRCSENQNENQDMSTKGKSSDQLEVFFEGLCKFARYSKFETCGTIRSGDLLNSASVVCSLSFDPDEEHIAAAGISKKIKIFDFNAFMNESVGVHYPLVEMVNKSKLSCVCWNSYIKNYLASTDYDGVVQIWDAGTGQGFSQYTEHQKRAWSVDFSPSDPTKFVSGSDDCSVKLWSINEKRSLGTIWSPANVCCVQFSSYSNHLLAFGSADYKVYCYDLRYVKTPWCTLAGHEKAVSYVKFMDSETIVSASTDNSLKLWNLNKTNSSGLSPGACSLTYKGHTNQKNFVGLSVLDGYIACGSETNEVYSYYKSLPMPMTSYKFGSVDPISGNEYFDDNGQFVSSVCWRKKSNMLVAANSTGNMKLLKLV